MSEQVVKAKNEGRVAAGKRLVEWNRKNKEDLLKNKNQEPISGESSAPTGAEEPTSATSNTTLYGGVSVAVALAGIAVFFLWKRNTPNPTPQPVAKPEDDIFRMN